MHQQHQNKLLRTCLSPWQHVEANESIRRCFKRFLIAETSPLGDFCGFKHSEALQEPNINKNYSKNEDFEGIAPCLSGDKQFFVALQYKQ